MKQRSLHVLSSEMQKAQHRTHKIRGSFFGFVHLRSFSRSARTNKWNVKWLVRQVDIKTKLIFFLCVVFMCPLCFSCDVLTNKMISFLPWIRVYAVQQLVFLRTASTSMETFVPLFVFLFSLDLCRCSPIKMTFN